MTVLGTCINERSLSKHLVIFDILYSGPVSEKPDEGLFFVDKETEKLKTTGKIHKYYIYHTILFLIFM